MGRRKVADMLIAVATLNEELAKRFNMDQRAKMEFIIDDGNDEAYTWVFICGSQRYRWTYRYSNKTIYKSKGAA